MKSKTVTIEKWLQFFFKPQSNYVLDEKSVLKSQVRYRFCCIWELIYTDIFY